MTMGERIRLCRKNCNLTQKQLAELLHVQEAAVSKWEKGIVENIPRSTIERMSKEIFHVNPCYLMAFSDDPQLAASTPQNSLPDRVALEYGPQAAQLLRDYCSLSSADQKTAARVLAALAAQQA